jgi:uncharacterized repeat protein (TIGR03803 family)
MSFFRSAIALGAFSLLALTTAHADPAISALVAFYPSTPTGNLVRAPDGALYGTSSYVSTVAGGVIYRLAIDGSSIETVYQLSPDNDGLSPAGGLTLGTDGMLYGTTKFGRAGETNGAGTIFRISTSGSGFTVIHRFDGVTTSNNVSFNAQGAFVDSELVEGSDTYMYGGARNGGANGTGTVYKVSHDGSDFQVLHTFDVNTSSTSGQVVNAEGAFPEGQLVQGSDGFLYGVTSAGGANGRGTIYRVCPTTVPCFIDGTSFQVLHTFSATTQNSSTKLAENADGAVPLSGLTDGQDGFFYGTTSSGATGLGNVYAISADGATFTVLYQFDGATGSTPIGELLLGVADGKLYGTTSSGGVDSSDDATTFGTIFSINRDGTGFARLHSFDSSTVGYSPNTKLVEIATGDLIGVVSAGGKCGGSYGSIFRWSAAGTTYDGDTKCGFKKNNNNNGGGAGGPALLLLLGGLGWVGRRVRSIRS